MTLEYATVDARAILQEVKSTLLPEAENKGVEIEIEPGEQALFLSADKMRLLEIIVNVAGNAVKFTPTGGRVQLSARSSSMNTGGDDDDIGAVVMLAPESAVEFKVQDNGIGIPQDKLDNIFDPFYQVDGGMTREYGGIGLGLTIVKKLVDAHGGSIRIESAVDQGATVVITLPEQPHPPGPAK